jgi:hypothetical protein
MATSPQGQQNGRCRPDTPGLFGRLSAECQLRCGACWRRLQHDAGPSLYRPPTELLSGLTVKQCAQPAPVGIALTARKSTLYQRKPKTGDITDANFRYGAMTTRSAMMVRASTHVAMTRAQVAAVSRSVAWRSARILCSVTHTSR